MKYYSLLKSFLNLQSSRNESRTLLPDIPVTYWLMAAADATIQLHKWFCCFSVAGNWLARVVSCIDLHIFISYFLSNGFKLQQKTTNGHLPIRGIGKHRQTLTEIPQALTAIHTTLTHKHPSPNNNISKMLGFKNGIWQISKNLKKKHRKK